MPLSKLFGELPRIVTENVKNGMKVNLHRKMFSLKLFTFIDLQATDAHGFIFTS